MSNSHWRHTGSVHTFEKRPNPKPKNDIWTVVGGIIVFLVVLSTCSGG